MFSIAVVQTKVYLARSAHKSYRSLDAILRFFDYLHGLTKTTTKTVIGLEPPKLIKLRIGVRIGQH